MTRQHVDRILFWSAVSLGLAVSTGLPIGISLSFGMPCVCLLVAKRSQAFQAAFGYYAAALWPMIAGVERYLNSTGSPLIATTIWLVCAVLLSVPWSLAWSKNRRSYLWRVPVTILLTVLPPIGIFCFASPIVSAGFLFPGCAWTGLLATAILPGAFLAASHSRAFLSGLLTASVALSIAAHLCSPEAKLIPGWEAVNTHFGDVSRPFKDYEVAHFVQERVASSSARVLIFPEFLIPRWSEATAAFWSRTLLQSRARGQVFAIGAGLPRPSISRGEQVTYDFASSIAALRNEGSDQLPIAVDQIRAEPFDNAVLILGNERDVYKQRIPVPFGMWRPFSNFSVPLRLTGTGVVEIDHQRAAILICYEQLLPWPVLTSMIDKPSVIVGVSNTFWFHGTAIPRYQRSSMQAWARLFAIPMLSARNS